MVERAQAGDRGAADELLRRHYELVYAVCRKLAGNDADALDATQNALMAIMKGLPRYDGRSKFSTWAYRVASNACLDELRRRKRRPIPHDDDIEVPAPDAGPGEVAAVTIDVHAALDRLPEEFRAPVVLRDLVGMDYAEIATTLDLAPGTVRSRISRGRAALAALLGNHDPRSQRHIDRS